MPTYSYKCTSETCNREFERLLPLARYTEPQYCVCGSEGRRVITAPAVCGDYEGYSCPITGKHIEGRRAHEENLKRHGCRVLEPGEKEVHLRKRASEEAQLDRAIEDTVGSAVAAMPQRKQEKLANELAAGVDAVITRL